MTNAKHHTAATKVFSSSADVVRIPYDDLITSFRCESERMNDIHQLIEEAFSSSGLGIIAITDVPKLSELRLELLPLAQKLATLSPDQLDDITVPESNYQVGWVSL
jgi:hypothetical protein